MAPTEPSAFLELLVLGFTPGSFDSEVKAAYEQAVGKYCHTSAGAARAVVVSLLEYTAAANTTKRWLRVLAAAGTAGVAAAAAATATSQASGGGGDYASASGVLVGTMITAGKYPNRSSAITADSTTVALAMMMEEATMLEHNSSAVSAFLDTFEHELVEHGHTPPPALAVQVTKPIVQMHVPDDTYTNAPTNSPSAAYSAYLESGSYYQSRRTGFLALVVCGLLLVMVVCGLGVKHNRKSAVSPLTSEKCEKDYNSESNIELEIAMADERNPRKKGKGRSIWALSALLGTCSRALSALLGTCSNSCRDECVGSVDKIGEGPELKTGRTKGLHAGRVQPLRAQHGGGESQPKQRKQKVSALSASCMPPNTASLQKGVQKGGMKLKPQSASKKKKKKKNPELHPVLQKRALNSPKAHPSLDAVLPGSADSSSGISSSGSSTPASPSLHGVHSRRAPRRKTAGNTRRTHNQRQFISSLVEIGGEGSRLRSDMDSGATSACSNTAVDTLLRHHVAWIGQRVRVREGQHVTREAEVRRLILWAAGGKSQTSHRVQFEVAFVPSMGNAPGAKLWADELELVVGLGAVTGYGGLEVGLLGRRVGVGGGKCEGRKGRAVACVVKLQQQKNPKLALSYLVRLKGEKEQKMKTPLQMINRVHLVLAEHAAVGNGAGGGGAAAAAAAAAAATAAAAAAEEAISEEAIAEEAITEEAITEEAIAEEAITEEAEKRSVIRAEGMAGGGEERRSADLDQDATMVTIGDANNEEVADGEANCTIAGQLQQHVSWIGQRVRVREGQHVTREAEVRRLILWAAGGKSQTSHRVQFEVAFVPSDDTDNGDIGAAGARLPSGAKLWADALELMVQLGDRAAVGDGAAVNKPEAGLLGQQVDVVGGKYEGRKARVVACAVKPQKAKAKRGESQARQVGGTGGEELLVLELRYLVHLEAEQAPKKGARRPTKQLQVVVPKHLHPQAELHLRQGKV
jgi:hypothetical protein